MNEHGKVFVGIKSVHLVSFVIGNHTGFRWFGGKGANSNKNQSLLTKDSINDVTKRIEKRCYVIHFLF